MSEDRAERFSTITATAALQDRSTPAMQQWRSVGRCVGLTPRRMSGVSRRAGRDAHRGVWLAAHGLLGESARESGNRTDAPPGWRRQFSELGRELAGCASRAGDRRRLRLRLLASCSSGPLRWPQSTTSPSSRASLHSVAPRCTAMRRGPPARGAIQTDPPMSPLLQTPDHPAQLRVLRRATSSATWPVVPADEHPLGRSSTFASRTSSPLKKCFGCDFDSGVSHQGGRTTAQSRFSADAPTRRRRARGESASIDFFNGLLAREPSVTHAEEPCITGAPAFSLLGS